MTIDEGPVRRAFLLEVCVDNAEGLEAAVRGGADRIELCSALGSGGLTPSCGFMQMAAGAPVPVHALIRPRIGDFCYRANEVDLMIADICQVREAGLAGVVIGATTPDGALDEAALTRLVEAAAGLDLTLHRAVDMVADVDKALDLAIALGFSRVLTSGGARHAEAGLAQIAAMASRARGRISIMPGGGVRPENASRFLAISGIAELHASCSQPQISDPRMVEFGFSPAQVRQTDEETVRVMKAALDAV